MKKVYKDTVKDFGKIFSEFGDAMAEVFKDPKLKKELAAVKKSVVSSAKTFVGKFKDEDVKKQFSQMSKAAHRFGKKVEKIAKGSGKKLEKSIEKKRFKKKKNKKKKK